MPAKRMFFIGLLSIILVSGCDNGSTDSSDKDSKFPRITIEEREELQQFQEKVNHAIRALVAEEERLVKDLERLGKEVDWTRTDMVRIRDAAAKVAQHYENLEKLISKDTFVKALAYEPELAEQVEKLRELLQTRKNVCLHIRDTFEHSILVADAKQAGQRAPAAPAGSPIVRDFDEGGIIQGVVRDAVTGQAVGGAQVGFREASRSDYFDKRNTDSQGRYASPHLRPGTYAVDVMGSGYVRSSGSNVRVTRGQVAQENTALTAPLGRGVYRITMSWTQSKANAVRDVDSYLAIPGVELPLSYRRKGYNYHGSDLDRDDTDWIGPETVTIRQPLNGTYVYYVNNFSDRQSNQALGNSDVRVKVYFEDRMIAEYDVPAMTGFTYEVFRIVDGQLKNTQRVNDALRVD